MLNDSRANHIATLLPNGRVLVAGGYGDVDSAELFEPASGTWARTCAMNTGRTAGHTATMLTNGKVLVAGGSLGAATLSSTELYDPTGGAVTTIFLTGVVTLPNGAVQFSFTNAPGASFSVLGTSDMALPVSNWTRLGSVMETTPGQFQFSDPQATSMSNRFYRVRSP